MKGKTAVFTVRLLRMILFVLVFFALQRSALAVVNESGISKAIEDENTAKKVEVFRILIENKQNGDIKTSIDKGQTWTTIGKVLMPTTKISPKGYEASRYTQVGHVAATAVNARLVMWGRTTDFFQAINPAGFVK